MCLGTSTPRATTAVGATTVPLGDIPRRNSFSVRCVKQITKYRVQSSLRHLLGSYSGRGYTCYTLAPEVTCCWARPSHHFYSAVRNNRTASGLAGLGVINMETTCPRSSDCAITLHSSWRAQAQSPHSRRARERYRPTDLCAVPPESPN